MMVVSLEMRKILECDQFLLILHFGCVKSLHSRFELLCIPRMTCVALLTSASIHSSGIS